MFVPPIRWSTYHERTLLPCSTASFGDDFGQFGGIFLSCQMIWTDLACLLSLLTCFLSIFTHKSIWHLIASAKKPIHRLSSRGSSHCSISLHQDDHLLCMHL